MEKSCENNALPADHRRHVLTLSVQWLPEVAAHIRGVVQISHGMAEHCLRYPAAGAIPDPARLCRVCVGTIKTRPQRRQWRPVWTITPIRMAGLGDRRSVPGQPADSPAASGVPLTLFAHSMGSFIARGYVFRHATAFRGW